MMAQKKVPSTVFHLTLQKKKIIQNKQTKKHVKQGCPLLSESRNISVVQP